MTATRLLLVLVPAAAVAAGNYVVLGGVGQGTTAAMAWLVASPVLVGIFVALVLSRADQKPVPVAAPPPAPAAPPPTDAALRLLGALQEEGRFVDFVEEDLGPYSDDQIGAAVRSIHEGCRKALRERIAVEPVLRGAEGETVTVAPGFDPAAVRLTGNVTGAPPFQGTLRHSGWRVVSVTVPERAGQDPRVLAPAEVELG